MATNTDGVGKNADRYSAARLRADYLTQTYPEPVDGTFWYSTARDLLALSLYVHATEQGIVVSDADLNELSAQLAASDLQAWLAEPAAQLGLTSLANMLTVPGRTRDGVVHLACTVLASHRIAPEAGPVDDLAEVLKGNNVSGHRLEGHDLAYWPDDRLWRCVSCGETEKALQDPATGEIRSCQPSGHSQQ